MKSYLYGLRKRLRQGTQVYIYPDMRCNLTCSYCTLNFFDGVYPNNKSVLPLERWVGIIDSFTKVREIVMTGGEPMLYPEYNELCNYILSKGYFLTVFSNLQTRKGLNVVPSSRFFIYASKHKELSPQQELAWDRNFREYDKKYRVQVDVLGDTKPVLTKEQEYSHCYHRQIPSYSPDGRGFANLHDMMEHLKWKKK